MVDSKFVSQLNITVESKAKLACYTCDTAVIKHL